MNSFNRIFQHPPEKQFFDKYSNAVFSVEDIENMCASKFVQYDVMLLWLDRFQEVKPLQAEATQHGKC